MAYTRSWNDLITVASVLSKGVGGLSSISADICDFISNDMYTVYPWKDTITTIAQGTIPLLDGVQDYSSPINIYRLTKATIVRYDTTPFEFWDLDIVDDNSVDLVKRSYATIRSCSQQQGTGTLRLECAIQVGTGNLFELVGEYQLNPVKIVSTSQGLWFKDQYAQVALEGLMYWAYKLSDDARESNQLNIYRNVLARMKGDEDWGASNQLFPASPIGVGRDENALNIFGP